MVERHVRALNRIAIKNKHGFVSCHEVYITDSASVHVHTYT